MIKSSLLQKKKKKFLFMFQTQSHLPKNDEKEKIVLSPHFLSYLFIHSFIRRIDKKEKKGNKRLEMKRVISLKSKFQASFQSLPATSPILFRHLSVAAATPNAILFLSPRSDAVRRSIPQTPSSSILSPRLPMKVIVPSKFYLAFSFWSFLVECSSVCFIVVSDSVFDWLFRL